MLQSHRPQLITSIEACVDAALNRIGKRVVLGLPVGIGKPNALVNAFVRRALNDSSIDLTIFTALSLRLPKGRSDLERRFLDPFVKRVFGDHIELEYTQLLARNALPGNIKINEFFLEPGAWLHNDHLQQNYLSANYTHVARDLIQRGVNVIAQLVAPDVSGNLTQLSLSCNPDLTVDLLTHIRARRDSDQPVVLIGQVHRQLPFMFGDAAIDANEFDFILDDAMERPLFCPPNMPISTTDYLIALNVSSLVRDGGTLQLGIGELGDAIVYGLKLRHENQAQFAALLAEMGTANKHRRLITEQGGIDAFTRGVYGCTEMLVDGFVDLYHAGILKRHVYGHALLQTLLDNERISEVVGEDTLAALSEAGLTTLTNNDLRQLQAAGVFKEDCLLDANGSLHCTGKAFSANLSDADNRHAIAQHCLATHLKNGVLVHGGFFFGPKAFYAALRELPETKRRAFAMQRISFINQLYGEDQPLKMAQRRHARFVNTTMMVTGLGAAVSDGLANGEVVSGVGGQYNFVAMAHALPDARSILCVRSTRSAQGKVTSNIVWNYAHVTIPRHLRDIVVTEYGIADLRGRTDSEVVAALVEVMDARFQDEFVAHAKAHHKLPHDYRIPDSARNNTPQRLEQLLKPHRTRGLFEALPFGSDFTPEELVIAQALKRLQAAMTTMRGRTKTIMTALLANTVDPRIQPYLERLQLLSPTSFSQRLQRRLVAMALKDVLAAKHASP